ncbi:MAG: hypothetical protein ABIJ96_09615 [Elusimicrobiota bacterium]
MRVTRRNGLLRAAAAVLLAAHPVAAEILPPSSAHVRIEKAEIEELDCSRRPFQMENTKAVSGYFPYMSDQISASGWHPHSIVMGVLGMLLLVPMTVIAAPTDLIAGPFRRRCTFKLKLTGAVVEWAGKPVSGAAVGFTASNLLRQGIQGRSRPTYVVFDAAAVTAADGKFEIATGCSVGRDKALVMFWQIKDRKAGQMRLEKKGGSFLLSQPDAGFGVGSYEMQDLNILPKKAGS